MKKIILSALVIFVFVGYVIHKQLERTPQVSLSVPTPTPESTTSPFEGDIPATLVAPTSSPASTGSNFKDGTYTGDVTDAFYGNVQVQVSISGGKITNVDFLQYPNDRRTSIEINSQATPLLSQEAIKAQSSNVDIVSGATQTSLAFIKSLQTALDKAI